MTICSDQKKSILRVWKRLWARRRRVSVGQDDHLNVFNSHDTGRYQEAEGSLHNRSSDYGSPFAAYPSSPSSTRSVQIGESVKIGSGKKLHKRFVDSESVSLEDPSSPSSTRSVQIGEFVKIGSGKKLHKRFVDSESVSLEDPSSPSSTRSVQMDESVKTGSEKKPKSLILTSSPPKSPSHSQRIPEHGPDGIESLESLRDPQLNYPTPNDTQLVLNEDPQDAEKRRVPEKTQHASPPSATVREALAQNSQEKTGSRSSDTTASNGCRLFSTHTIQQLADQRLNNLIREEVNSSRVYTDAEISEISMLLKHFKPSWSVLPRAYVVLRTIGYLDQLDDLVAAGFSDLLFPVTEHQLPSFLSPNMKASFVQAQGLVLSSSLQLEKGVHCSYKRGEPPPFEGRGVLGRGGYGQVDRVLSLITFREYARKQVSRGRAFRGQQKERIQQFITEIKILQRIEHHHVVKFVGSYTDSRSICLLMTPVAEMDLSTYLKRPTHAPELRTFFGCLATALEHLHDLNIRHKDIKPGNILVDRGRIYFTDFGLSLDFTDSDQSTTISLVTGLTPRYCAPEVMQDTPRKRSSDIWSLGVVFLEMAAILKGKTFQQLNEFHNENGPWQVLVRTQPTALPKFCEELEGMGELSDNIALTWARQMLSEKQEERPNASSLVESITMPDVQEFCGICCFPSDDDISDQEGS